MSFTGLAKKLTFLSVRTQVMVRRQLQLWSGNTLVKLSSEHTDLSGCLCLKCTVLIRRWADKTTTLTLGFSLLDTWRLNTPSTQDMHTHTYETDVVIWNGNNCIHCLMSNWELLFLILGKSPLKMSKSNSTMSAFCTRWQMDAKTQNALQLQKQCWYKYSSKTETCNNLRRERQNSEANALCMWYMWMHRQQIRASYNTSLHSITVLHNSSGQHKAEERLYLNSTRKQWRWMKIHLCS